MQIAILAVQGGSIEHRRKLEKLGVSCTEIRKKEDLKGSFDGLILPGGESTAQTRLIRRLDLYDSLKKQIQDGIPVLATCAGLILLAEEVTGGGLTCFGTLPIRVKRNAYGRQLGSFHTTAEMKGIGKVPMTFIRAPYIEEVRDGCEILASVDGKITAVRYGNQYGMAFHPELDEDDRIHAAFLERVKIYADKI